MTAFACRSRRNNRSEGRFVSRATLAALVRGPARHPPQIAQEPKAGPCSDRRAESRGVPSARWFEIPTRDRPQTLGLNSAGFSRPFTGRGLLLLMRGIAMLLGNPRKSGGPPPLEPSFKVKRDVHNQRSGLWVAPGVEGPNARGPLKVHPECPSRRNQGCSPCAGRDCG